MIRTRISFLLAIVAASLANGSLLGAQPTALPDDELPIVAPGTPVLTGPNAAILAAVHAMPPGGKYSAASAAFTGLGRAVTIGPTGLRFDTLAAQPSFCSGATYLVFLQALAELSRQGALDLDPQTLSALLVAHQRDGQGVWGRWNANGPGTARLFAELHLGRNFTDFSQARAGDFMKIFWTDEIGQREHGHSVIYLGTHVADGKEFVNFWSSNMASGPGDLSGYGTKIIPKTRVVRAIFSRLENPENIAHLREIAPTDPFLASLLSRRTTFEEVRKMCDF
jgi:hypothetical protein